MKYKFIVESYQGRSQKFCLREPKWKI